MRLNKWQLTDGFPVYDDQGQIWVPLSEVFRTLEFPIYVNTQKGIASGWFLSENREFKIDLNEGQIYSDGKKFKTDRSFIERQKDDIYVKATELSSWFPIRVTVDYSALAFIIESDEPLPIEIKKEQEKLREALGESDQNKTEDPHKKRDVQMVTSPFNGPLVDLSVMHRVYDYHDNGKEELTSYTLLGHGIAFYQDTELAINDSTSQDAPTIRMSAGRKDPERNLLGFASEYRMGDVNTTSQALISNGRTGRGAYISSFPDYQLSETNKITLRGELPVGWEVEAYRNGVLIDFITEPNADGRYEFIDLSTITGLNVFKLIFYGPQGQRREEEKSFYIQPDQVNKKQFSMRAAAIEEDRHLIETSQDDYIDDIQDDDKNYSRYMMDMEYGLTETFALRSGFSHLPYDRDRENLSTNTNNVFNDQHHRHKQRTRKRWHKFWICWV